MRNLLVRMCIPKPHHAICRVPNIQHGVVHTIAAADHIAHLGNIAGAVCGEQIWKQPAALFSYIIIEAFFSVFGTCNKYATIKGYAQRKCIPLC